MTTIKDLLENEELMNDITEDLEDFDTDTEVHYEVWALGYEADDEPADAEMLLGTFDDPDQAISFARNTTLADVVELAADDDYVGFENSVSYISVEVETVVEDTGDEDGGTITMNIGTIYKKDLDFTGDDDFEENPDPIVPLTDGEYEILKDGSIEVPCELLKDFNKNDYFQAQFKDEDHEPILTYKIISKTTSNKYICEFEY